MPLTATIGRLYLVAGRDRFNQRYVEVGRAERVVPLSDGARVPLVNGNCPTFRLTRGKWRVWPQLARVGQTLDGGIGKAWFEINIPVLP